MLLGDTQNHTGSTYHILNLRMKCIVLSCDVIWENKTYGGYLPRKENTKANIYILKNEDEYYNWDHEKMDPIKTVVKTKNEKTEERINIDRDYRGEEVAKNTINIVSLEKQDNQVK